MSFKAEDRSIYDLLNDKMYSIPNNQRKYVWNRQNWDELFNDVKKSNDCSSEIDQLKINANICTRKHKFLAMAIRTLIPLFAFMVAMFFTSII